MALYRVWGEKVIPAVLLLLSVAYIVDASYNPFLVFSILTGKEEPHMDDKEIRC